MSLEFHHYVYRVIPVAFAFAVFLWLVPRKLKSLRIFAFILLFILFRDAMTPEGLWTITESLEVRFIQQPMTLMILALSSLALVRISHLRISERRNGLLAAVLAHGTAISIIGCGFV